MKDFELEHGLGPLLGEESRVSRSLQLCLCFCLSLYSASLSLSLMVLEPGPWALPSPSPLEGPHCPGLGPAITVCGRGHRAFHVQ